MTGWGWSRMASEDDSSEQGVERPVVSQELQSTLRWTTSRSRVDGSSTHIALIPRFCPPFQFGSKPSVALVF
ncbi:hypothetical protein CC2G_006229 [Coprinopsis cinerea AmutBmut pab1-1]|nr:hypothetical protein CC2G_006229 [Coprinopsis cinerea AmutBmut pab1-1]